MSFVLPDIVEKTENKTPEDRLAGSSSVEESQKHEDIAEKQKAEMAFCDVVFGTETGEFGTYAFIMNIIPEHCSF